MREKISGTNGMQGSSCCGGSNDCGPSGLGRRDFLRVSGMTAAMLMVSRTNVMAGPFTREDFERLVPADKKLSPEWVKSLFERGTPEILRGSELNYVGMPIGGIGCGQLYLGGDGTLWHWGIFNPDVRTGHGRYASPSKPSSPLEQRFALTIDGETRPLDRTGFNDISFRGEYPIGRVDYADDSSPVAVELEAFSPFIPLNLDDSSLPATIMQFTLRNVSSVPVEATLTGELENAVCLNNRQKDGVLRNALLSGDAATTLLCSAEISATQVAEKPSQTFEDWSHSTYEGWEVEGTAFGNGPIEKSKIPDYQGDVGGDTANVVNSHATAPGNSAGAKDNAMGRLTSRAFTIKHNFITFWIGGGRPADDSLLGLSLFVDGKRVLTKSGQDSSKMSLEHFNVQPYLGKTAHLEIMDDVSGRWANVGVGKIVFTDTLEAPQPMDQLPDYGTMALTLLGAPAEESSAEATAPFTEKLSGSLGRKLTLAPGASTVVTFVIAWHFPNLTVDGIGLVGRHYATRFDSANEVVNYLVDHFDRLTTETRLWRDTWYDSTLPFWFLDRTFLNASTLATSTTYRFADGRYWGWEGVGCCEGTCTHVYHYAHTAARLFPELERGTRENVDFGLAQQEDGSILYRAELRRGLAVDGQAGTILRALREHQMSSDASFLQRIWPKIKLATQWLIAKDINDNGLIEGAQPNTLDATFYGKVAWTSGLYLAALVGAAEMADEVGDAAFARQCRDIVEVGRKNFVEQLFVGDYFINLVDPKYSKTYNTGTGCSIDQVLGQSWAHQVGLPRVLPEQETVTALKSIYRYNFSPDLGPYREAYKPGRWYAMPGEAGLLMCSFPRVGWDYPEAIGKREKGRGYFNECMNGFEYQAAGHMLWEGLDLEGLAVTRAVHDRYHASKRNPWNEVECGEHYARSMASYGVYIAACGYEYHGPKQHLGFAPRLTPGDFKCAFTAAEGWGSFAQKVAGGTLKAELAIRWGKVGLKTVALAAEGGRSVQILLGGKLVPATHTLEGKRLLITLTEPVEIAAGETLEISVG